MFKVTKKDSKSNARIGVLTTPHGKIKTPVFMPVGTHGAVKTLSPDELKEMGADIILGNTYHLYLRPGDEYLKSRGGLNNFIKWDKPILTDSGGFQVFSLAKKSKTGKSLVKIKEDGVEFRSHLDGSKHFFTPKKVIDIQKNIGSDIMMVLDECAPYPCSEKYAEQAMNRTHRWAEEALKYKMNQELGIKNQDKKFKIQNSKFITHNPLLFGIIQGSTYKNLREESAKFISSLPFDGIAIGGVSVGEGKSEMYKVLDWTMNVLNNPNNPTSLTNPTRPIYLMGVGTPEDILEGVERGVDMFDCVLATRLARHGTVWTKEKKWGGKINLLNLKHRDDDNPIMKDCDCYTCRSGFSRAYLRHLLIENETLAMRLTTIHNVHFLIDLMAKIRENIKNGTFTKFKKDFLKNWA